MNSQIKKIILGCANEKEVFWDLNHSANSHVAMIGGSGSGKSVQAQKIICEIAKKGGTVLIVDMHGSLTEDQIFEAYKEDFDRYRNDINVYETGIPCHLFESVVYPDGSIEYETDTVGAISDILYRSLKLGTRQRTMLRIAVQEVMEDKLYIEYGIKAIEDALRRNGDKISLELAERMHPLFVHNVFVDGDGLIMKQKINIVHLSKLDLTTQEIIAELILSHVWRLGNAEQFKKNNLFVFLDECQNMDSSSKAPLALLISEGRRMGINLILATQMILQGTTNSVQQRISQCGLMLYFKPAANRVGLTAKMINPSNEVQWTRTLVGLKVGEFVAAGNLLLKNRQITYPLKVTANESDEYNPCMERTEEEGSKGKIMRSMEMK